MFKIRCKLASLLLTVVKSILPKDKRTTQVALNLRKAADKLGRL